MLLKTIREKYFLSKICVSTSNNLKYSKKVCKCGKAEVLNRASFEKGETKGGGIERERGGKDLWENVGAVEASRRRKQEANK